MRILVVDDDADQRELVRHLFARSGHAAVVEARDGAEALEVAAEHRPDLIVLDLAMPIRSGADVLPELCALLPQSRIVVLSNLPGRKLATTMRGLGAMGYVEKRVPPDRLVRELLLAAALSEGAQRTVSAHLPAELHAGTEARRLLRDAIADDDTMTVANAELLVSELVTNAVVHASSSPVVDIHVTPAIVRVEVRDDDSTLPELRAPDPQRVGGSGMYLVDQIASRWGVDLVEQGKVVWFELDRDRTG